MPERARSLRRRLASPWVRIAVTALFLGLALFLFPRQRILSAVRNLNPAIVLAALPAYLVIQTAAAAKWRLLVKRAGAGLSTRQAFECCAAGVFGALFLPSAVGADAVTVTLGMSRARSKAGIVSGAFLNRALDVVAMAVLVSCFAAFVPQGIQGEGMRIAHLIWAGGALAGAAVLLASLTLLPRWRPAAVDRFVQRHREALQPVRRPTLVALPLAISLCTQVSFGLLSYTIGRECGVRISLGVWLFCWTLAKLVILLPITMAGIGARELALAALLAPFGVASPVAVATGLVWDVVVVAGSLSAGVAWKLLGARPALSPPSAS
jgi:uncharacterized membrane protein YbhN (UPF0104 family)